MFWNYKGALRTCLSKLLNEWVDAYVLMAGEFLPHWLQKSDAT